MHPERPTYVSSDLVDEQPLSPSHLLYGRTSMSLNYPDERPEEAETSVTRDTLSRHSQSVQQFTLLDQIEERVSNLTQGVSSL